ncbi:UDP-N-acetylmuramoyl-tripeptide--D-alanyl-D-alanine ligase [Candidatus Marinimicrobia bacterium]|nr:UDP-N-acetylmuramoyl-tripeptide--D-alanyl-D-alanine ligase [Candidatus Neomarinimicrobiota bacterium]
MRANIKNKDILRQCLCEITNHEFNRNINGIVIDSRKIEDNDIFLCIQGGRNHGSHFIDDDILNKVSYVITDNKIEGKKILHVKDSRQFLNELATKFRKYLETKFIVITGTNGKTSTKELLYQLLKTKFDVSCSRKNYNTTISMPMSILECSKNSDFCILEMGASKNGEIGSMCKIANPDYGVVTNISESHLEGYSNFNDLIKTKMQLFEYLSNNNGIFFRNLDDENVSSIQDNICKTVSYSYCSKKSDYHMRIQNEDHSVVYINDSKFQLPYLSKSFKYNFLCSYSIAAHLRINNQNVRQGLKKYKIPNGRGNIIKKNNYLIVNDSYNANYESMKQGISDLKNIKESNFDINLFLSDMSELGEKSQTIHEKLGHFLNGVNFVDNIFLIGKAIKTTYKILQNMRIKKYYFEDSEIFFKKIDINQIDINSINYIKGSRSMKLEKIMEIFDVK